MIGVSSQPARPTQPAWEVIARQGAHLRSEPTDTQARHDLASALTSLGLRTLALHELKALAEQGVPMTELEQALQQAGALPGDVLSTEQSEMVLRANLDAIGWNPPQRADAIAQWRAQADSEIRFRAEDGNQVRLLKPQGVLSQMQDARGVYRTMLEAPLIELTKRQRGPIVLDGINPPWILQRLLEDDAQPSVPGFRQRLCVSQRDPVALCEGLSVVDLSDRIGDRRIDWFVGSDAVDQLAQSVNQRPGIAHSMIVIANPANREPLTEPIQQALLEIGSRDASSNLECSSRINARYQPRDRAYWADRFAEPDARLRILIPTSRHTTYLQHACADLRDTLNAMGHECLLLTEPDEMSLMVSSDYLSAIDELDPDLLISMNHTRCSFNGLLPKNLPVLSWIQDAMGHLFSHEQGESIGELDFVIGMVHREFIEKFGFHEQQTRWHPMVASGSKFSPPAIHTRQSTEIAYVTHQSEPVDEQCERLVGEFVRELPDKEPELRSLIGQIKEVIVTPGVRAHPELNRVLDACFFPGSDPGALPILRANLLHGLVLPVAERIFRHQTIGWVAQIAERHGWPLRLYGNGWDRHPRFADYAAGPIEHSTPLASCYQHAAVHLHASIQQPLHQRVTECLLSGGLPVTRVVRDAFAVMNNQAVCEGVRTGTIEPLHDEQGVQTGGFVRLGNNQAASRMVGTLRSLGLVTEQEFADGRVRWVNKKIADAQRDEQNKAQRINAERFASMTDLFFANEQTLESLLSRAIEDPSWREQTRTRVRDALPDVYTMDGFARSAIGFVRDGLTRS